MNLSAPADGDIEHAERLSPWVYVDGQEAANGRGHVDDRERAVRGQSHRVGACGLEILHEERRRHRNVSDRAKHRGDQGHRRQRRSRIDGKAGGFPGRFAGHRRRVALCRSFSPAGTTPRIVMPGPRCSPPTTSMTAAPGAFPRNANAPFARPGLRTRNDSFTEPLPEAQRGLAQPTDRGHDDAEWTPHRSSDTNRHPKLAREPARGRTLNRPAPTPRFVSRTPLASRTGIDHLTTMRPKHRNACHRPPPPQTPTCNARPNASSLPMHSVSASPRRAYRDLSHTRVGVAARGARRRHAVRGAGAGARVKRHAIGQHADAAITRWTRAAPWPSD